MPIKYGELTIVKEKPSLFYWINEEIYKCIFLFDNGEICDTVVDFHFKFLDSIGSVLPLYFEKHNQLYFDKKIKDTLCFNPLFMDNPKYKCDMNIESTYNCIYYCHKLSNPDIFGLVRIKSTKQMPRFQFAYDSDEFTKEEIIYVIHHILSKT
jgi:hypothetical protein